MTEQQAFARIQELTHQLNEHNYQYYVLDRPSISDQAFDALLQELELLEKAWPQYLSPQSPSQRVGGQALSKFENAAHRFPMMSLGNTYSRDELSAFDERVQKGLGKPARYVGELKFDGVAISLTYENGQLVRAITRGDGQKGDVVTENIKTIRSIPLQLRGSGYPTFFEMRGEVFIQRKDFEKLNEQRLAAGEEPYANPRNFASGSLKLLNPAEVSRRKLDCFVYYLNTDEKLFHSHHQSMEAAKSWGFRVCAHATEPTDLNGLMSFIDHWELARTQLGYDIDGIVIKVDDFNDREELGYTAKSPRWAISYKYKPMSAITLLESVSYQVGRTGAVTPVANLKPVLLAGTVVKRASLYNEAEIERLDLHLGDQVFVEKGGEIIPKVMGVDVAKRPIGAEKVAFISHCPDCGSALEKIEAIHYCLNDAICPPQQLGRLEHFVARKAMDLNSIGKETIVQLFEAGLVRQVSDFYDLQYDDLLGLERMGDKSVRNLLEGLEASKQIPYERVLFGLGIRLVGETVAKTLAKHFPAVEMLAAASQEELVAINEIGEKIARNVVAWFRQEENLAVIEALKFHGLQLSRNTEADVVVSDKLSGQSFVISGVFERHERDELKAIIEQNGGKVLSGVSGKTNFLLAGDGMGPSKLQKAQDLGVKILTENEFEEMLA
ncbi:MAG: NAD-dependent DNA ligase LigA [Sphingobacteriaceae bacterium]|nr:NAD-dependent DNA ligase LigA [Sphingobacteriaceae bacterium]